MRSPNSSKRRYVHRFSIKRRTWHAGPATLRRRQLRVLPLWRWMLIYTSRDHWSNRL